jgi:hypothetical protein
LAIHASAATRLTSFFSAAGSNAEVRRLQVAVARGCVEAQQVGSGDALLDRAAAMGDLPTCAAEALIQDMPSRAERSDAELKIASKHLHYELGMLRWLAVRIAEVSEPQRYAYLESFIIHARNLFDFLWPNPKRLRDSDVIAADFAHGTTWTSPSVPPLLLSLDGKGLSWCAAKYLGHLTYDRRATGNELDWPNGTIAQELDRAVGAFVAAISATHASRLVDELMAPADADARALYTPLVATASQSTTVAASGFVSSGTSRSSRLLPGK